MSRILPTALSLFAAAILAAGCHRPDPAPGGAERLDDAPPYKAAGSPPDCTGRLTFVSPRQALGSSQCRQQGASSYRLTTEYDIKTGLACDYRLDFTGGGRARGVIACGGGAEREFVLHDLENGEIRLSDGTALRFRIDALR